MRNLKLVMNWKTRLVLNMNNMIEIEFVRLFVFFFDSVFLFDDNLNVISVIS